MDRRALELLNLSGRGEADWSQIKKVLPRIFIQWYEFYCRECSWLKACDKNGFFQKLLTDQT